jgi:outer membrane protein assembly factor BamB
LGAIEAQVVSSPDEATLYVDTLDGNLVALARADGAVRFRVPLGGRSYATPCVDDRGNVYSASDAKKLFAVRPDGHVIWTLDLDDEGDTACAIADDGTLVFAAGRTLYGVTQAGSVAWRFVARGKIFTAPAIDDRRRVIFGSQDHHVYAVEPSAPAAHKAWSVDLGADVDGSPAIDDDGTTVVGTDAGEVVRLDADGSVVWSTHVFGFVRGALSIARGGDVLAGVYGPRSRVVRLDGKSGVEKASFDVPGSGAAEFGVHGAPIEDAVGNLYFGAEDDRVYAIAPSGTVTSLMTGGDVDAPVTLLSDGALVVASDDGAVYYLEP